MRCEHLTRRDIRCSRTTRVGTVCLQHYKILLSRIQEIPWLDQETKDVGQVLLEFHTPKRKKGKK